MKREVVKYLQEHYGFSERRSCRLMLFQRRVKRYEPQPDQNGWLRKWLKETAEKRRRFGSPQMYNLLRMQGVTVNHKRVERIYREEGLSLKLKRRRKKAQQPRQPMMNPEKQNERWSMDFVSDQLFRGRRFRCLTIIDDATRECVAIEVGHSLTGERVTDVLDQISATHGLPQVIRMDNGPEFQSKVMDAWAHKNKVIMDFTRPGKPTDNAIIESFNGKFRNECLNESWFTSLEEAKQIIKIWRQDYNENRPHSSLGGIPPSLFVKQQMSVLNNVST